MMKLFSHPRFLVVYSGLLTVIFVLTIALGLSRGDFCLHRVSAAEQSSAQHADFDTITVHRINIVEPDGTPRLIISDKAEFPGEPFKGKELPRPDRNDSAGMLFMNDEGTENGGLISAAINPATENTIPPDISASTNTSRTRLSRSKPARTATIAKPDIRSTTMARPYSLLK